MNYSLHLRKEALDLLVCCGNAIISIKASDTDLNKKVLAALYIAVNVFVAQPYFGYYWMLFAAALV